MQAFVYKSLRKQGSYLYLARRDDFASVPEPVLTPLGRLEFVLEFELTAGRRLAQADPAVVRNNLASRGFHLQVPPTMPDPMVDG